MKLEVLTQIIEYIPMIGKRVRENNSKFLLKTAGLLYKCKVLAGCPDMDKTINS